MDKEIPSIYCLNEGIASNLNLLDNLKLLDKEFSILGYSLLRGMINCYSLGKQESNLMRTLQHFNLLNDKDIFGIIGDLEKLEEDYYLIEIVKNNDKEFIEKIKEGTLKLTLMIL